MTHWSTRFVGLPWMELGRTPSGVDCWGLVCEVYRSVLRIELPSYVGCYADPLERRETAALIASNRAAWPWLPLAAGKQQELDLVLTRRGGIASHVGILIDPVQMLHVLPNQLSSIERIDSGVWVRRIDGYFAHASRAT